MGVPGIDNVAWGKVAGKRLYTLKVDVGWPVAFYVGRLPRSAGVKGWVVQSAGPDGACVEGVEG